VWPERRTQRRQQLPPKHAARRRTRTGEPFRGHDYSGKRWREEDLPALDWRHRQHYDMKATFITLALEDGADPHVIETRVTHTKKSRSAFDGYNRGRQWAITCAEVVKLKLARKPIGTVIPMQMVVGDAVETDRASDLGAVLVQSPEPAAKSPSTLVLTDESWWRRRESNHSNHLSRRAFARSFGGLAPVAFRRGTRNLAHGGSVNGSAKIM
jgi:hypothetical protein